MGTNTTPVGKFGYSIEEDGIFYGEHNSPEETAAEAFRDYPEAQSCWVGEIQTPVQPEDCVDGHDLIELVANHEDYLHECACDWPGESPEQRDELTEAIRKAFGEWLDRYNLRPTHYTVGVTRQIARNAQP